MPFAEGVERGLVAEEVGRDMRTISIQEVNPITANVSLGSMRRVSPMNRQGGYLGASVSTTSSSRASGAYRMADTRADHRWI